MAIQNRRGAYADFNPAKMVEGEFAVVKTGDPNTNDGDSVYISTATGTAKRVALYQDIVQEVESATTEVAQDLVQQINEGVAENVERAETAASNASDSATAAENSAQEAEETLSSKANVDGYYANMTVGTAEQLVSSVGIEDKIPYVFRPAGGSIDIGDREDDTLIGGSFPWNQLTKPTSSAVTGRGVTITPNSDGSVTISGTTTSSGALSAFVDFSQVQGHKYLIVPFGLVSGLSVYSTITASAIFNNTVIKNSVESGNASVTLRTDNGVTYNNVKVFISTFDLTLMFGTTIADYIYSLEQATAGAGVAWFRKYFPKPYYAYNAGSMESVQVSAHNTTGLNQFDKSTIVDKRYVSDTTGEIISSTNSIASDYISIVPGATYYIKTDASTGLWGAWYDANKNYVSGITLYANTTKTAPDNAYYARFTIRYSGNTGNPDTFSVSLHWDGERDGEYEPYVKRSYPIDSFVVLRGIPKLDADNHLYYDGDVYKSDGTVTRKYGIVDLGTLTWIKLTQAEWNCFQTASLNALKKVGSNNFICEKYGIGTVFNTDTDKIISGNTNNGTLYIRDSSYTDAATFKSAMSGVYLVYELATETTEQAESFTNPQIVDDWGTEEYVDAGNRDVEIPVGHDTYYMANLKAKLEMAPNSPDGDGDYIVRQTDSHNAYVPLAETSAIQHLQETKANIDGYYDEMTVGNAEQLISTVGIEDQTPVVFRPSGGSADIGDRAQVKAIVGGSVPWNQLVDKSRLQSGSDNGITLTANKETGEITVSGTATAEARITFTPSGYPIQLRQNAIMYLAQPQGASSSTYYIITNSGMFFNYHTVAKVEQSNVWLRLVVASGVTVSFTFKPQFFDLTQMLGATVADYLNNLNNSNTAIATLKSWGFFQKDYYPYNAGGLESVQTSGRVVRGFNAWDEEWELGSINFTTGAKQNSTSNIRSKNYIPVIGDATYYGKAGTLSSSSCVVFFYRADKTYISNAYCGNVSFTTPAEAAYALFYCGSGYGTTYNHDICINLHWDGERDGEYEEYTERTYPLDPVVLRGVPRLDANNNLYYDGDRYEPDGTVTRRYGIVDLGTLNWTVAPSGRHNTALPEDAKSVGNAYKANIVCSKYQTVIGEYVSTVDKSIGILNLSSFQINDSSYNGQDAATFKTAMSGIYVIYEKAEETTETAEPYRELQWIDDWGTEEYTDAGDRDFAMPVGQDVVYQPNLRAKLEMSPNSPDSNGDYVVRHNNGTNEYVELTKELPAAPTSNGTYVLKVTVSGSTVTYAWEAQS